MKYGFELGRQGGRHGFHGAFSVEFGNQEERMNFRSGEDAWASFSDLCPLCENHCPLASPACGKGVAFMKSQREE